ncbi:MAG: CoA pyrophosphatase [Paracoccaceae bacterium]
MITKDTLTRAVTVPSTVKSSDFDLNPDVRKLLPNPAKLRDAAVLVPVVSRQNGWQVILTKRAAHLKHHPGQIAFPGGKLERGETPLGAALREAHEEIGLARTCVKTLGSLDTHETVTHFTVTPILGIVPSNFIPTPEIGEVEEVFEVPLDFLLDPANMQTHGREWQGHRRQYYVIPYGPYYIWGATARMIKGLADRVMQCG